MGVVLAMRIGESVSAHQKIYFLFPEDIITSAKSSHREHWPAKTRRNAINFNTLSLEAREACGRY
jgi:hypothetical protein